MYTNMHLKKKKNLNTDFIMKQYIVNRSVFWEKQNYGDKNFKLRPDRK